MTSPSVFMEAFRVYCEVPQWRSGLRHSVSVQEVSLQSLVPFEAVSHPDMIGSPTGRRTIGPALSGFGRGRPSL